MPSFYKVWLVGDVSHVDSKEMRLLPTWNLYSLYHHYGLCAVPCFSACVCFDSGLTVIFFFFCFIFIICIPATFLHCHLLLACNNIFLPTRMFRWCTWLDSFFSTMSTWYWWWWWWWLWLRLWLMTCLIHLVGLSPCVFTIRKAFLRLMILLRPGK